MYFCVRDDDTSFFTSPDDLENAYGEVTRFGPVSLAVVPFHRAGPSKGVPENFRGRWSVHPLHENHNLVEYLREKVAKGRFEIMLHGYHHDELNGGGEFAVGSDLLKKAIEGRRYLEDLVQTRVRVFVPPRNSIARDGLKAIIKAGLHLSGTAGVRSGWPLFSWTTWRNFTKLRIWRKQPGTGIPWILDLGDHREIPGNAVTPTAVFDRNKAAFDTALTMGGTFCAATHYWELGVKSVNPADPPVGDHLRYLIDLARADTRVRWRSVGDVVCNGGLIL